MYKFGVIITKSLNRVQKRHSIFFAYGGGLWYNADIK